MSVDLHLSAARWAGKKRALASRCATLAAAGDAPGLPAMGSTDTSHVHSLARHSPAFWLTRDSSKVMLSMRALCCADPITVPHPAGCGLRG